MKIENNLINPFIKIPYSKSYINRNLILASLAQKPVIIEGISLSDDVIELINGLKQVGLVVLQQEGYLEVENNFYQAEQKNTQKRVRVKLGNGGTTFRFLLILLSLGSKKYEISLKSQLAKRDHQSIITFLQNNGVYIENSLSLNQKIIVQGPLKKIDTDELAHLDVSTTSQGISALKLCHPKQQEILKFKPEMNVSNSYLSLTEKCIERFNQNEENLFNELDHSSLVFFIVWGLFYQEITISNLTQLDQDQPEYELIKKMEEITQSQFTFLADGLNLKPIKPGNRDKIPQEIHFDLSEAIDAIFPVILMAILLPREYKISNINNLKYKEVDRLQGIQELFSFLNISYEYDQAKDLLKISAVDIEKFPDSLQMECLPDHRFIMLCYFILKYLGRGSMTNTDHVSKSFPGFFDALEAK